LKDDGRARAQSQPAQFLEAQLSWLQSVAASWSSLYRIKDDDPQITRQTIAALCAT